MGHSTWYGRQRFVAKIGVSYKRELNFHVFLRFDVAFPTLGGHVVIVGGPCAVLSVSGWCKLLGTTLIGPNMQYLRRFLHVFLAPNIDITSQVIKMLKNSLVV